MVLQGLASAPLDLDSRYVSLRWIILTKHLKSTCEKLNSDPFHVFDPFCRSRLLGPWMLRVCPAFMKTGAEIRMKKAATQRVCDAASSPFANATKVAVNTPKAKKCNERRSRTQQTCGVTLNRNNMPKNTIKWYIASYSSTSAMKLSDCSFDIGLYVEPSIPCTLREINSGHLWFQSTQLNFCTTYSPHLLAAGLVCRFH